MNVKKAPPMQPDSKIYVAGHRGLAGSAIVRALQAQGFHNLVLRMHAELDLCDQQATNAFFASEKPEYVFLAAAKVGGIHANDTYPAEFIRDNLLIQTNVIDAAYHNGCKKLLFLGSSCIYPRDCPQPIKEEYLLTGPLEPTNEWYAIAKIAGIKMCQAYRKQYGFDAISAMPTNLYGPGDNFHPENSHVLPALIRRFHEAKVAGASEVTIWGTGTPRREFLYVDDLAEALVFLMQNYSDAEHMNVGCCEDLTIMELAELVAEAVGYTGEIQTDPSQPDGTPRKLLDVAKLRNLGWTAKTGIREGLYSVCRWYVAQVCRK
ncbi:bifunctional GDP-fucose synthetase: GDP-4-dehydro-6-deoxy-D-mannose epimerase and GDP-4-dehydro-6-L-deoxygalactose reductase [uncultured delta proteobacterium]|uniref:GDP-L-fucose synthase n=1 Tax=uncultured delta proteobacterium TaxID=34034 RepID=A0A212KGH9_9DELT|nr:bifunctional GDP-fucose synthetase: GDP-4-dehydro-6-deoxy-D-mannose epimerase and GDP-4-dehydro-6-L-deoxygalactose reductase [uncultured delta proteobacterium]